MILVILSCSLDGWDGEVALHLQLVDAVDGAVEKGGADQRAPRRVPLRRVQVPAEEITRW